MSQWLKYRVISGGPGSRFFYPIPLIYNSIFNVSGEQQVWNVDTIDSKTTSTLQELISNLQELCLSFIFYFGMHTALDRGYFPVLIYTKNPI